MNNNENEVMIQFFEWYLPADCSLWNTAYKEASYLSKVGFNYIWLPPAYKATGGIKDVGYGVYDLYDLGEFDQKGAIPTKYGTKNGYLDAIQALHENGLKVVADIVFNQKMGADETEKVIAIEDNPTNRTEEVAEPHEIVAWTKFTFPGRGNTYSPFKWNWTHFHGVDWDESEKKSSVFRFYGKHWDELVDKENGNFDYLMGCDVDLNNVDVVEELTNWGKWYLDLTKVDGFRMDAVKHIRASFFEDWLKSLNEYSQKSLFTVGEYWSGNIESLTSYLDKTNRMISLFDVPLHYNFFNACHSNGNYDMRTIFNGTLVGTCPDKAVTFVDNHDTEPDQSLASWIDDWFKPLAYSLILLRKDGLPTVFYGDLYGIPSKNISDKKNMLEKLLYLRKNIAYGVQTDYFNDSHIIGWVREGDTAHPNSGLVVIMTNSIGGCLQMNVGKSLANTVLYDYTGNLKEPVYVDNDGNGIFYVDGGSVSVWTKIQPQEN